MKLSISDFLKASRPRALGCPRAFSIQQYFVSVGVLRQSIEVILPTTVHVNVGLMLE